MNYSQSGNTNEKEKADKAATQLYQQPTYEHALYFSL